MTARPGLPPGTGHGYDCVACTDPHRAATMLADLTNRARTLGDLARHYHGRADDLAARDRDLAVARVLDRPAPTGPGDATSAELNADARAHYFIGSRYGMDARRLADRVRRIVVAHPDVATLLRGSRRRWGAGRDVDTVRLPEAVAP